eukprot:6749108-Ditylum_brightwellii.AAC.1
MALAAATAATLSDNYHNIYYPQSSSSSLSHRPPLDQTMAFSSSSSLLGTDPIQVMQIQTRNAVSTSTNSTSSLPSLNKMKQTKNSKDAETRAPATSIGTGSEENWRIATKSVHTLFHSIQSEFTKQRTRSVEKMNETVTLLTAVDRSSCSSNNTKLTMNENKIEADDAQHDGNRTGFLKEKSMSINETGNDSRGNEENMSYHHESYPVHHYYQQQRQQRTPETILDYLTTSVQHISQATSIAQSKVEQEWERRRKAKEHRDRSREKRKKQRKRRELVEEEDNAKCRGEKGLVFKTGAQQHTIDGSIDNKKVEKEEQMHSSSLSLSSTTSSDIKTKKEGITQQQDLLISNEELSRHYYYDNCKEKKTSNELPSSPTSRHAQKEIDILVAQDTALLHGLACIVRKKALDLASTRMKKEEEE